MGLKRFIEWHPRYREAFKDPVFEEVYDFIASPHSVWAMVQASENGKPALAGIVKELESKFATSFDFDNPMNRRMIGSMIKEIVHDFGYRRKGQRMVSNSDFFTTASYYELEADKASRKVTGIFEVHSREEGKELIERKPGTVLTAGTGQSETEDILSGSQSWTKDLFDKEATEIIDHLNGVVSDERSTSQDIKEASSKLIAITIAALKSLSAVINTNSGDLKTIMPNSESNKSQTLHAAVEKIRISGEAELNREEANLVMAELLKKQKDNEELSIEKTGSTYKLSLRPKGD